MSPLTGKRINNNKKSSVKDVYIYIDNYICSFGDFTVLNYESHKFKPLTKEFLRVNKDKPSLNKQVKSLKIEFFGSIPVTLFYHSLDDFQLSNRYFYQKR